MGPYRAYIVMICEVGFVYSTCEQILGDVCFLAPRGGYRGGALVARGGSFTLCWADGFYSRYLLGMRVFQCHC